MGYQTALSDSKLANPLDCTNLCHIRTEGSPNGSFNLPLASLSPPPPTPLSFTHPPPRESIRVITGAEKLSKKPAALKYLVEFDSYITTIFIQYIWHNCIVPQEKHSAFNISNLEYKMCRRDWF